MEHDQPIRIDCTDCVMEGTDACADCVVTFLCGREPDDAVIIDVDEARALVLLAQGGLAPGLRHRRRTAGAGPASTALVQAAQVDPCGDARGGVR